MSTDEERAKILRAIASGGFSPYDDSDGSTANVLYGWADEIEQVARVRQALCLAARPAVHRKRGFLYRFYLRLRLRAKLRWLGLVPVLILGTIVPNLGTAQAPDSLYALPSARAALGEWKPQWTVWCLTRHADFGTLFLIVAVAPPDTAKQCARPDSGSYPLVVDLPECPRGELQPTAAPFMLVRCDGSGWMRFPSKRPSPRTI
jgi:hypothetical protein